MKNATDGAVGFVMNAFNLVVGTQAIGGSYQFTGQPPLIETARIIKAMGANLFKFSLKADTEDKIVPDSLLKVARDAPSVRTVLDMPFSHYLLWAYPLSTEANRFQPVSFPGEYRELYDLTRFLLKTYHGTGKSFYLGNWEGDWHFLRMDPDRVPTGQEVKDMIGWVNIRQKAIEDAKRDTPHSGVEVYHYLEVNRVVDAMQNKVRLTNQVLPHTTVDYVSYSSYDSLTGDRVGNLKRALDYIESKLMKKVSLSGKRVFVGEYGFPARDYSPEEQDAHSREVMETCLAWGCRFCLYWELFNNEVKDGKQIGYWMIDDKNRKQPVYFTHTRFYSAAHRFMTTFQKAHKRFPTHAEFCRAGRNWFGNNRFAG